MPPAGPGYDEDLVRRRPAADDRAPDASRAPPGRRHGLSSPSWRAPTVCSRSRRSWASRPRDRLPGRHRPCRRRRWPCGCGRGPSTSWSGQEQLRSPGSPLRQLIEGDQSLCLLLWGPPGTGKTTIAGDPEPADRPAVRGGVGGGGGGQGGPGRDRQRPRRAGRAAAARPCSSSTRCTASARPSRTRCCPGSRTAGSRWWPPRPRTRSSASSRRCSRAACCCAWSR